MSSKRKFRYLVINGQSVLQERINDSWMVKKVKKINKEDEIIPGIYYQGDPVFNKLTHKRRKVAEYKDGKPIPFSCFRFLRGKQYNLIREKYDTSIKKDTI